VPLVIAPFERPIFERPIIFELVHTINLAAWRGGTDDPLWLGFAADLRRFLDGERAEPTPVQVARGVQLKLPKRPLIAVLPFTDMAGAAAEDHFVDGMVEEITTALSQFKSLFVITSSTSLTYRGAARDTAKICRELGVRYLIEGSFRRSGDRVRVNIKLLDGLEGEQIWADRFEDSMEDIFELQDRVANTVAGLVDSKLETAELHRAITRPTRSPRRERALLARQRRIPRLESRVVGRSDCADRSGSCTRTR
jgi:TolB-like protein